jgi:P-type E1-E2 ATPase
VGSILVFVSWKPLGQPPAQANLALAIVLLAVFFIQAAFNAWQDWSSSRVMASITTMLPDSCLVLRDGAQVTVMASDIVPGDVLFIKSGNKLPADVRFVEISSDAKFDRSILTGKLCLRGHARCIHSRSIQANHFHCQARLIAQTGIISRQDVLVFKVLIAYLVVGLGSSYQLVILLSLARLQR